MPRRQYKKRQIRPDSIYDSYETEKLVNYLMKDGKKNAAYKIIYGVYEDLEKKKMNPLEVLRKAIANVAPTHEVRPKRVGGASYLVPSETRQQRKLFLALKWILEAAGKRSNKEFKSMRAKLLAEITDAASGQGEAVSKKAQVEKLAEANKAFAHFRW